MEVSAQAIHHKKVAGIKFKYAVFTNISSEHLDFFGSMEEYVKCKMNFFNDKNMDECVINIDDFYGMELAYKLNIPCVSVGIKNPANAFAIDICGELSGTTFAANILDTVFKIKSPFVGEFNIYNLLCAMTIAKMWGLASGDMVKALSKLKEIPGRFNVFNKGNNLVVVDFAHTPDSIAKILSFVKGYAKARVIVVIGCVGYSDINKRIDIASECDKYGDIVIITTDNRGKTPFDDIASDMLRGISGNKYYLIEDRKSAIEFGIDLLKENDILMVLGKGAEDFQKIEDERVAYCDLDCVKNLLKGTV